ncbi:MAG: hypothetical protein HDR88_16980 [Bacteroides sp.]|nr:hypothetical protein [Bacteroides sp.]
MTIAAENIVPFSYTDDPQNDLDVWGNGKAEIVSVAIKVDDTTLSGSRLHKISVPIFVNDYTEDYKVWASTKLETDVVDNKRVNKPEYGNYEVILPTDVDKNDIGILEYVFSDDIPIGEEGLYVGYTFTVTDGKKLPKPIIVKPYMAYSGAFLLQSSRTDLKWTDYSTQLNCVSPMTLEFIGDFEAAACGFKSAVIDYAGADAQYSVPVTLMNRGFTPIEYIEYTASIDGKSLTGKVETNPEKLNNYGNTQRLELMIPQVEELGVYDLTLTIDKVNGVDNNDRYAEWNAPIEIITHRPIYKPLMEEYTGTGCPQCTRGLAALEKMNELHEDRFVAVSYHGYNNDDPMVMQSGYPWPNILGSGFPNACLNRSLKCDPYWGSQYIEFGIEDDWYSFADQFSPVEISVDASWNDEDSDIINITSSVSWALQPEEGEYRMAYVLVADDLHSTDPEWLQSNSLAGSSQTLLYLDDFIDGKYGTSPVIDYYFNDVAILTSEFDGISGSIPFISTEENTVHEYSFNLNDAVNLRGKSIVQDKDKLRVVAMVLKANSSLGTVMNCETTHIKGTNSIEKIESSDAIVISEKWYDISGKTVMSTLEKGIYIHVVEMSDGTVKKFKQCVK